MDQPDVIEQLPSSGPAVNQPTSGSYGDVADLDRLKSQLNLPGTGAATPASGPAAPPPGMPPGPPPGAMKPGRVPDILMSPTDRPDIPVSNPLNGPAGMSPAAAVNAAQKRLQLLDFLATSDNVSPETQQWARMVRDALAARKR